MIYSIENTNKRLKQLYGSDYRGRVKFRLVWSEDIFEKVEGEHTIFDDSGKYLRTEKGIREVPKYEYMGLKDRHVLENVTTVPNKTDDYEPLFTFQDKHGNALEPVWKVMEIIIDSWLNRHDAKYKPKITQEMLRDASVQDFMMKMSEESSDFGYKVRDGSAILLPGKDF